MATTTIFLAFADGAAASNRRNPAAPGQNTARWAGPGTGGTCPPPRPLDACGPWAGVVASRLRRAALLAQRPAG